jgi:signal recognition particle receptor subunit beta
MASINRLKRELLFKLVFYGPGLGGKTTTLRHIHAATKPENRGNMVSLATDTDRTLYFDFLPVQLLKLGDMTVKLQLYTVPGQVYYAATRKLVLSGADGIVFVADTQSARLDANHESLDDLNANLAEQGRKLSSVPHVFQWNKRDLPDVVPVGELDRRLNLFAGPSIPTVATTGEGVFETLERVTRLAVEAYRSELPSASKSDGVPLFLDADEIGLADAIKGLADSQGPRSPPSSRRSPEVGQPTLGPASARKGLPDVHPSPAGNAGPPGNPFSSLPTPPLSTQLSAPAVAKTGSGSGGAQTTAARAQATFSLSELWPAAERELVRRAEHALAAGDAAGAVAACEEVLARVLAAGATALGGREDARDPVLVVTLLGLDGARYLGFRGVAGGLRARRPPSSREALECYAFVLEARRAFDRSARGP